MALLGAELARSFRRWERAAPEPVHRVSLENNVVGISALGAGATGDIRVTVEDSTVAGSSSLGLFANSAAGQSFTRIMVDRTAVVNNSIGISVNGTQAGVLLANSTVTSNINGLVSAAGGQIFSYKTNKLNGNITSDGVPGLISWYRTDPPGGDPELRPEGSGKRRSDYRRELRGREGTYFRPHAEGISQQGQLPRLRGHRSRP